ncbi:MAG: nuclear transport factor 2 family protein [Rhizobiales bacterium]|nr:nuclear transport factor 2 family protein [Rhizobacter sp.]
MKDRYVAVMRRYMQALHGADYPAIVAMFAPGGSVVSPFLGEMLAEPFFDRLGNASTKNVITPIDIFVSADETPRATAYFRYDWTVTDGTLISFEVMDLFEFAPGTDRVQRLSLIYDTHPIRSTAGNKYELAAKR